MTIQAIKSEQNESSTDSKSEMVIHRTYDYHIFNNHFLNRKQQINQLKKLLTSMLEANLLSLKPLIVSVSDDPNFKFDVIDGNHRLQIARELNYEIFYIIVPIFKIEMLINLNFAMSLWGNYVYLGLYCKLQKQEYLKFNKFMDDFKFDAHEALPLAVGKSNRKRSGELFKLGKFVFHNEEKVRHKVKCASEFLNLLTELGLLKPKKYRSTQFYDAYFKLMDIKDFDQNIMLAKVKKFGMHLLESSNMNSYYTQINTLYTKR
jgi:hypothetical protein